MNNKHNGIPEIAFTDPAVSDIDSLIAGLRPEFAADQLGAAAPALALEVRS